MKSKFSRLAKELANCSTLTYYGKVLSIHGGFIESSHGGCIVGESAIIESRYGDVTCEVVSSKSNTCMLSPLNAVLGIATGDKIRFEEELPMLDLMTSPFGKVLDGYGKEWVEISSREEISKTVPLYPKQIALYEKDSVRELLPTGCTLLDRIIPIGKGQKLGVFAGSGVGKSTLLNNLNNNIDCDVKIFLMVGERSREAADFYNKYIESDRDERLVLIVSVTEDSPSMKKRAVYTALAYAKFYASQGKSVLFLMDSITRLAHSLRELGISRGELPIVKGYPPSVFSELSKIVEQCGCFKNGGSITAIFSVLVDGEDFNEPVSDFMRGILDGHIILDRRISNLGLYPAINILASRSRIIGDILSPKALSYEKSVRATYSRYEELRDFINTGMYVRGSSEDIDKLIETKEKLDDELFCWEDV
ncbi:TPA: FliI/YscN family ATPase [Vibrio vulnificus]|nr:FliI/YscN family ATPase [Vibrio vulnificus]